MAIDFDFLLFSSDELCSRVVERARYFVPQDESAFPTAFKKIEGAENPVWERRVTFGVLKERHPEVLKEVLTKISQEYNSMRARVLNRYPVLADKVWSAYQMTGSSARSPIFTSMFSTESEEAFARFYVRQQLGSSAQGIFFESWRGFDLVETDEEFMFGVKRYTFKDKKGQKLQTPWDLREKILPRFNYSKDLS
jgi:hypothetical protein